MKKSKLKEAMKQFNLSFNFKSIEEEAMIVRGVLGSDDTLDRHGDRINPQGWVLENFLKNPVILLNHNSWSLPIGKAINIKVTETGLIFDIQFSKTYEKAKEVFGLISEKIMNAWSVGFIVLEGQMPNSDYTINKMELLELSAVTLPANPNALTPKQVKSFDALNKFIESNGEKSEPIVETPEVKEPKDKTTVVDNKQTTDPKDESEDENELVKRVEALEAQLKELKENSSKNIQEALTKFLGKKESDEVLNPDPTLLALNAIQQELRDKNKDSGKALQLLNKVLNSSKEQTK